MTSDRWTKIQTLFEAVADLADSEREAYLHERCADDPDLYEEVISLLKSDRNVHKLLHGLAIDVVGWTYEQQYIGKRIGPYRILRHIGSGGMSYVFLAEREDGQFRQRVALKLIKRGMESEHIIRRFRSERQILSQLDHPNIARLFDGGITDDGVPYFTMDYVDGIPLDRYCDTHRLSVEERLKLFRIICGAVHYAHGNLVVHRDLKPGNIFVTGDGTPKLLDFGIAKLLGDGEDTMPVTRTGIRVMTPEYASPEQVQQRPITTAADVYSLGIILYELLTGHRPYRLTGSSPAELERIVCTVQPDRPSSIVSLLFPPDGLDDREALTPETLAALRNTTVQRLRKKLRGDLDTICLTALRKEPERRYRSPDQLMQDLQRYASGLPVDARRDTASYRLQKFVKRHRRSVAVSGVVVLMLVSLSAFYTMRLAEERDRAQLEAVKAEQISAFLRGLFEISDPSDARGESVTARELLERGAQRVRAELADQPEIRATMMDVIGTVYHALGLYSEANTMLQEALSTRTSIHGDRHPLVATTLNNLARTYQELGDFAAAEEMFTNALEIQRSYYRGEHEDIAVSTNNLAELRRMQGNIETAEGLFLETLSMYRSLYGDRHPGTANALHSIAVIQNDRGDYEHAEENYRTALDVLKNLYGEYHPDIGNVLTNLASLYRHIGDYAAAEPLYLEALEVRKKVLDADHPDLAYTYNHMGRLYQSTGSYAAAEQAFLEGLRIREKTFGKHHQVTTASLSALANLYEVTENYARSESLYVDTYGIMLEVWGEDHPYIGAALNNIGRVQHALGKLDSAERYLRQSVAHQRKALPEGHVNISRSLLSLGLLLNDTGRASVAEGYLRETLEIREKSLPEGHQMIEAARIALGIACMRSGNIVEAESLLSLAYDSLHSRFGEDHRDTQRAADGLAELRSISK